MGKLKKRYKVQGDTRNTFIGIELDLVIENDEIGESVEVLGGTFEITQNGKVLVLSSPEWVLTLQDITPSSETEPTKLKINETIDIFFDTKEIDVRVECTYEELFYFLQNEWKMAGALAAEPFPFDYSERLKLFTMNNEWNFSKDNGIKYVRKGSFSRNNKDGRSM